MTPAATKTIELATDLEKSYFDYAVETIIDRALPRCEDGLKPVQRRILYAMHDMGLDPGKPYKKSARVVGEVLGKYHPHGDSSVYMAMVRLAQDFSLGYPLIDGQGNFGSVDGDAPAAMRYTEARLAPISVGMMQDIERDTVDWTENFDGSLKEPEILPTVLPNLLVNGSSGVAVGMTTNIPPHNLGEVCDALVYVAQRWSKRDRITVDDLMRFIPGPDFPTGGVIYRYRVEPGSNGGDTVVDTIRAAYETGRGRIVTQARVKVEGTRGGKADIIITELPYAVQKNTVLERIAKEVRDGRIAGITDLRDESDYTGMRVVIEVSRLADPAQVLEALLNYTQLRQTFGVISLALVKEEDQVVPHLLPLRDMLTRFIEHRLTIIERRSRHELAQREARLHILEGLVKALDMIDRVVTLIRKSKTTETARANLIKQLGFSEAQAQAILDMQLRRLAALERQKLIEEGRELVARIKYLKGLLGSEAKRLEVVVEETVALRKDFATPRRTIIRDNEQEAAGMMVATEAELAEPEGPQIVTLTTRGIRRTGADQLNTRIKPGPSARAVEAHLLYIPAQPKDRVLLVSSRGRAWQAPVGRVPEEASFTEFGLDKGETLIGGGIFTTGSYLVIGARSGNIKRVRVEDLSMSEASWATIIGLNEHDEALFAGVAGDKAEIMFFTAAGKAIRFAADQVNPQATPSARGMAGIKVGKEDNLVAGGVIEPDKETQVIIVSQTGFIKRVPLEAFPVQGRGGQGVQSLDVTRATGQVAAAAVAPGLAKNVDILSGRGLRHRLGMDEIPRADRRKRGDRLVDFGADDVIVGAAAL